MTVTEAHRRSDLSHILYDESTNAMVNHVDLYYIVHTHGISK